MNIPTEISQYFLASSTFMLTLLSVAFGASIGAYARYCMTLFFVKHGMIAIPFGTLCVNLVGSFFIGLGTSFMLLYPASVSSNVYDFIFVGLLGALTTFSTFAYDIFSLWVNEERLKAFVYIVLNILGGFFVAFVGFFIPLL